LGRRAGGRGAAGPRRIAARLGSDPVDVIDEIVVLPGVKDADLAM
jgi:hypothetical protein